MTKTKATTRPAWLPRYDYGHWNERWGKKLLPPPAMYCYKKGKK